MSEIDPRADAPLVDWSDLGVSGLLRLRSQLQSAGKQSH
jgi:hypothetical protein